MHQHDKDNSQTVKHYVHCLSHSLKERNSDFKLALDDEEQSFPSIVTEDRFCRVEAKFWLGIYVTAITDHSLPLTP